MADSTDPSDDQEDRTDAPERSGAESPPANRVRRERTPEWPYAPADRRGVPPSSNRPASDRSPEWPYAPIEGRRRRQPTPESREQTPEWGLKARPDVDVADHPEEIHVWCDLPGCAEETIELSGDELTLYVSAERDDEYWEDCGIQRRERSRSAERSISLPSRCDVDAAEASFEDGVLFVRTPKYESEHTQRIGFE